MAKSVEEIKELWKAETDEWVRIAVTENINGYPLEVQAIIRAEAARRISLRSNPDGAIVAVENEAKPFRLTSKTQLRIGLICACFILVNETYNLVTGQVIGISTAELSAYIIKIVTLIIYVTALVRRKIRVVQFAYSFWLWFIGIEFALIVLTILSGESDLSSAGPITVLIACVMTIIPYLMGIYVLRIGLCGLRKQIKK